MTWVRKDDQMPIHRKVAPLTDAAYRLEDEAMCWASRNLTDGVVRAADLPHVGRRGQAKYADELVRQGLWHTADERCPQCLVRLDEHGRTWPADGWVIHDYLEYNPSRVQVTRERVGRAQRQQRWRDAKRNGTVDASHNGHVDALRNAPVDAAPYPARPAPKEAGRVPARTNPADPSEPKCKRHPGELAHNCRACRSEKLGAE